MPCRKSEGDVSRGHYQRPSETLVLAMAAGRPSCPSHTNTDEGQPQTFSHELAVPLHANVQNSEPLPSLTVPRGTRRGLVMERKKGRTASLSDSSAFLTLPRWHP
ncbi:hypothetical protein DPX16_20954 [Anabarilius grahami]|uniref:Uncharacterized protein n=1 Tax=Anabarilius grahami TaxID=495550 RepID=A0A3N0YW21_ANAGA|nr:hypothetical protein DPX16_20954 [Anabarilius grahami]